jgi:predicted RNA binding protein YcfA (HicA-like mRNA interferase family)
MTSKEVIRSIRRHGGREIRQRGAHKFFSCACGAYHTTVADHRGDMKTGTLHGIERDLKPCPSFGPGWLLGG